MAVAGSDASALIALDRIRRLKAMGPLLDGLLIPPAVAQEIAPTGGRRGP
jgi:hypothetical protein